MTEKNLEIQKLKRIIARRYEMLRECYTVEQQRKHIAIIEEFEAMLDAEVAA